MKTIFLLIAVLALSVYRGNAQPFNDTTTLRNLSHQKFMWLIDKDTAKLNQLLDKNLQYIHSNGWVETKTDVIKDLGSGKLNYKAVTVESDTVRLYARTAIITGRGNFKVAMDGKVIELKLLYTEVYVKQKKQWKLVQRNACKL